uniref:Glycolipid transfer protein domain-containing protein n=1 Tax=Compsopogon caeruleus TaxID=31354 RepID=A0A7S1XFN3_9RHOD|mmetsp:Transcript_9035/g.18258  ORF Transcript_9035/g.18258 Transcript_9035/m.18258 type:complete len:213 (+) Transcript_9035:856-1494(+)|eukprot:CAMPEP_0184679152 /NCGR_PEP_ID=MMETSP0312-20130426/1969_1 /TAXON_ID=31354 /ORGANISM="Compsopogon coeruleus, Strain SAG 36.94" /LENGTH=212 /DNA_ID=CAMNT_0027128415 /DNA_START=838 /DNA_END=1476 /DNA_ORIENTATION=+
MAEFNFETMLEAFERVKFKYDGLASLPDTEGFFLAMNQVALLFDHLGGGFVFVRRDILEKTSILKTHFLANPEENASLQDVVERELRSETADVKSDPPSAARTLLRMMWAAKFIYLLMRELEKSYQPGNTSTLRDAVELAYDEALSEHHSWIVRKAVGAAMLLLPSKEVFLAKLGVQISKREEYMTRVERSLKPLVDRTYEFYTDRKILDLP